MRAAAFTGEALFIGMLSWFLFDYTMYKLFGNGATISWVLLGIESSHPLFGLGIAWTLCTLIGHLTLPHFGPPPPAWREWLGVIAQLTPCAIAVGFIAMHPSGSARAAARLQDWLQVDEWVYAGIQSATAVAAIISAKFNVPQHIY